MKKLNFIKIFGLLIVFYFVFIINGCKEYDKEMPINTMLVSDNDLLKNTNYIYNYKAIVIDELSQKPVENAQVKVYKNNNNKLENYTTTFTTSDGSFVIERIEPGYYILEFLHIKYFDKRAYLQVLNDKQVIPASLTILLTPLN